MNNLRLGKEYGDQPELQEIARHLVGDAPCPAVQSPDVCEVIVRQFCQSGARQMQQAIRIHALTLMG